MTSFIIRRLLLSIIVIIIVSIMIFSLMRMLPGDPLLIFLGSDISSYTQEDLDILRHEFGLDKPLITQYFIWMNDIVHGDLGISIIYQQDVGSMVAERLPVTFNTGAIAFVISAVLGITFGLICASRRGKWLDSIFSVLANLGITLPNFWIGILLIYILSLKLNLLPTYGYTSPFDDLGLHLQMLIMPVFCLSVFPIAALTRQTRSSMLEVIRQDYVRTAWAKGLRERLIIFRHVIKNGLIPVVTTLGMQVSMLFGGVVLVEVVFNIPGMGRMIKDAVMTHDYPVVQGGILIISLVVVITNILVDIIYGWIDPRIRYN